MNTTIQQIEQPTPIRSHLSTYGSNNEVPIPQLVRGTMANITLAENSNRVPHSFASLLVAVAMLFLVCATTKPVMAETVGAPLNDRQLPDNACGAIFMLTAGFSQPGRVTNWSFFASEISRKNNLITPLIIEEVAGEYFIRAIGTTQENMASGVQDFSFDPVSGSDLVGPNFFIGWKDGAPTDVEPPRSPLGPCPNQIMSGAGEDNNGSIEFDIKLFGGGMLYFGSSHGDSHISGGVTSLGKLTGTFGHNPPTLFDREYSLQAVSIQRVPIDIKPGSDPNCFNINGHGVIPVALLGDENFNVMDVNPDSLLFSGLEVRLRGNKGPQCSFENLNMICHFEDNAENWTAGESAKAVVTGELYDGTLFEGVDYICVKSNRGVRGKSNR